ncbi:MAG TPA: hypothetical protein VL361_12650 [Candidatus Limnocylindrales bacterium]|nr:hypothetical protein [Candidatus Limnocylindrales bacterium]
MECFRLGQASEFAARWQGEWQSQASGHHGELRCILRRKAMAEWEAQFHATYARWLRVAYGVLLHTKQSDGRLRLQGAADLGSLAGGLYEYDGELKPDLFECHYRCKYDHGTFRLKPLTSG